MLYPFHIDSMPYMGALHPIYQCCSTLAGCTASHPQGLQYIRHGYTASHSQYITKMSCIIHGCTACHSQYITKMRSIPSTETPIHYKDVLHPIHRDFNTLQGCTVSLPQRLQCLTRMCCIPCSNTLPGCAASYSQRLQYIDSNTLHGCAAFHS